MGGTEETCEGETKGGHFSGDGGGFRRGKRRRGRGFGVAVYHGWLASGRETKGEGCEYKSKRVNDTNLSGKRLCVVSKEMGGRGGRVKGKMWDGEVNTKGESRLGNAGDRTVLDVGAWEMSKEGEGYLCG